MHCICPDGFHIYFGKKTHGYGSLDVDANVYGETTTPVENIRWPICTAPNGRYQFYVHDYTNRANNNPYKLGAVQIGQRIFSTGVVVSYTHLNAIRKLCSNENVSTVYLVSFLIG